MTFPIDYVEWKREWTQWRNKHANQLMNTRHYFAGRNLLADEVLGTWRIRGVYVELSAVTMPNFGKRNADNVRYVGISRGNVIGDRLVMDTDLSGVVASWEELDKELGLRS